MSKSTNYCNHRSRWTIRELDFVEKHYGKGMTATEIAGYLGRTPDAVRSAAHNMGFSRQNSAPWTKKEKSILRRYYPGGSEHVMARLPGRSRKTISWMAHQLGVMSSRTWSEEEEHILTKYYPEKGTAVETLLPGRTTEAIKIRASELGIRFTGSDNTKQRMWSEKEWACLVRHDHLLFPELLALFPDRSRQSVKKARERLRKRKKQGESSLRLPSRQTKTGR